MNPVAKQDKKKKKSDVVSLLENDTKILTDYAIL